MSEETTLDRNVDEFREAGHRLVEWIAEYLRDRERFPVLSQLAPGDVASKFARTANEQGASLEALSREFEEKILPGVTHWNHPAFFAYFAITGSQAGILGEFLSAALNINGMLWKTSPAATELETVALGWLRDALGLPADLFGIINDTASINTFLALAAAREATGLAIRTEGMTGRELPRMKIYCSDQAHSSVEKAALALGFGARGVVRIPSDERFRMDAGLLAAAIVADRTRGELPVAVVATTGTTSTASVDPVGAVADVCIRETIWLHVDAAYGGAMAIVPELRGFWRGIERADSIVVNPHKWLFTPVDCSVLYTRRPDMLKETFSLVPEYLKTTDTAEVNYMDYGLQLGRRFRALKLWMVLEHYGLAHIRNVIQGHIEKAARLAALLSARADVELLAPQSMGVVVFRKLVFDASGVTDEAASESASAELLAKMNASGRLFVSHTRLRDRYGIRVAIGNGATEWRHVEAVLSFV